MISRALLVLALGGCYTSALDGPTSPTTASSPDQPEIESAFAREIRSSLSSCDLGTLEKLFDIVVVAKRVLSEYKSTTYPEVLASLSVHGGIADPICDDEDEQVTYTFLHDRVTDGRREIILRKVFGNGNFNYLAFEVATRDGRARINDVRLYYSGELLTRTLAASMAAKDSYSPAMIAQFWRDVNGAEAREDWDAVHRAIDRLPFELRSWRAVIRTEMRIARNAGQIRLFDDAVARYRAAIPAGTPLEIVALDVAWKHKEHEEILRLLDTLDRRVGGDPYLDSIRADAYLQLHDLPHAVERARNASRRAAAVESVWWMLATAEAASTHYPAAVEALEVLAERFSADVSRRTLEHDDRFSDLVTSPAYRHSHIAGRTTDEDADPP
jgi:hypothetical protein